MTLPELLTSMAILTVVLTAMIMNLLDSTVLGARMLKLWEPVDRN